MREISYYEAKPGVFEPAPTRAQKRKAEKARAARAERVQALLLGILLAVCFAAYIAGNLVAFGGWWLPRI